MAAYLDMLMDTSAMPKCLMTTLTARMGISLVMIVLLVALFRVPAQAAEQGLKPHPGTIRIATDFGFQVLRDRLDQAVTAENMFVVTRASASVGASRRGVKIPGNMVVGVFRNDFAVRMLAASIPAGIEAPIRFYITENMDATTTLSYRLPSAVFAPYGGNADLKILAAELDVIWEAIANRAVKG